MKNIKQQMISVQLLLEQNLMKMILKQQHLIQHILLCKPIQK